MKKFIRAIVCILALLLIGFIVLNQFIYQAKQADEGEVQSYRATLAGEVICLPASDREAIPTKQCALGLQTSVGEFYALDFVLMSQEAVAPVVGESIQASGVIVPKEMLSSDHWQTYNIEGIFSVTDLLER